MNIAISREAMVALWSYDWPGNVRELENMVERLAILCEGPIIDTSILPENLLAERAACGPADCGQADRGRTESERLGTGIGR